AVPGDRPQEDGRPQRRRRGRRRPHHRRHRPLDWRDRGRGAELMAKHGKRYRALLEKVDADRFYTVEEAAVLVKELASAKFDETVEAHFRLGIDPRKSDQNVRGTVALPHGTGKTVRVLAITQGDGVAAAEAAGADFVGGQEVIDRILGGW